MARWLKWESGRQGSGYDKLLLFQSKFFCFDCYFLRFPHLSHISTHTDPVIEGKKHHRLNIVLKRSTYGGFFFCEGHKIDSRVNLFRPDIEPHSVSIILGSTRYVLSIGWLTNG